MLPRSPTQSSGGSSRSPTRSSEGLSCSPTRSRRSKRTASPATSVKPTTPNAVGQMPSDSPNVMDVPRKNQEEPGKEFLNSLTAMASLLILREGCSTYAVIATLVFSVVAAANHFCPNYNNKRVNIVVKIAFSHVILSTLNLPPWMGFLANALDFINETAGNTWRVCARTYMAYNLNSQAAVALWAGLEGIYFYERAHRIRRGMRDDYSYLHSLEHLNIVFLFSGYLGLPLYRPAAWALVFAAEWVLVLSMVIVYNYWCTTRLDLDTPPWFEKRARARLIKKTWGNFYGALQGGFIVPGKSITATARLVSWTDIETVCDGIVAGAGGEKAFLQYDKCIGILSGGGFIVPYVAMKTGIREYDLITSNFWSGRGAVASIRRMHQCVQDPAWRGAGVQIGQECNVRGLHILLVDDSTGSGNTLRSCKHALLDAGAASVDSFTMWSANVCQATYTDSVRLPPLYWPWGYECD